MEEQNSQPCQSQNESTLFTIVNDAFRQTSDKGTDASRAAEENAYKLAINNMYSFMR